MFWCIQIHHTDAKKAIRWALSGYPASPLKDILFPGMCFPGLSR